MTLIESRLKLQWHFEMPFILAKEILFNIWTASVTPVLGPQMREQSGQIHWYLWGGGGKKSNEPFGYKCVINIGSTTEIGTAADIVFVHSYLMNIPPASFHSEKGHGLDNQLNGHSTLKCITYINHTSSVEKPNEVCIIIFLLQMKSVISVVRGKYPQLHY